MVVVGLFPHLFSSLCPSLSCFVQSERLGFLPCGMSLHVDPQPVLGAASPKKSSLHKEVCGGLACSEGMRSTIQPTLMPDHSHFPGLAAVPCAPCRKAILVRSCWHQQAWKVPGLTQELQWPGALSQPLSRGHLGCELVLHCTEAPFWGSSYSRLSFLSPCS